MPVGAFGTVSLALDTCSGLGVDSPKALKSIPIGGDPSCDTGRPAASRAVSAANRDVAIPQRAAARRRSLRGSKAKSTGVASQAGPEGKSRIRAACPAYTPCGTGHSSRVSVGLCVPRTDKTGHERNACDGSISCSQKRRGGHRFPSQHRLATLAQREVFPVRTKITTISVRR
jgi:hypothetical protein